MWQPEQVERALFKWPKWRCSLIRQWMSETELSQLSLEDLKRRAKDEVQKLGLEGSLMAVYWISSVASECNLDYEKSFEKIVIPSWFPLRFDRRLLRSDVRAFRAYPMRPGCRIYPPRLVTEKDIDLFRRQSGLATGVYVPTGMTRMLLPQEHELHSVMETLSGRPKKLNKLGRLPKYPDYLAVKCTVLADSGVTYVQIGENFGFEVTRPYESEQCDKARHLANRGIKLINQCIGLS